MKIIFIVFACILFNFQGICQNVYLEKFDTKESLKKWKVLNNGKVYLSNNFTYKGLTFYKPQKDSFLILKDTTYNWLYSFHLTRCFKVIPSLNINFKLAFFSSDTFDYLTYGYKFYDKNKKIILSSNFPVYPFFYDLNIFGVGCQIDDLKNKILENTDSVEINFHFNPTHPYDTIERIIVIDEIFFSNNYADINNYNNFKFEIFPNPAYKQISFVFPSSYYPVLITLFDMKGNELLRKTANNQSDSVLNIENLKQGLYFIKATSENGKISYKKIIIY
ncbi:MAG: T9SS type A sorting domain-containing protein [Bacteroidetes bacterium]|nr:T9SS type A sorting domain-containing protein [Bacteroidota bacterium]